MEYDLAIKWSNDTHCNMDDPWKPYVKWNKTVTKDNKLYDSICMKYRLVVA